jgi:putative transposase
MPSSGCTKSSSAVSRRKRYCLGGDCRQHTVSRTWRKVQTDWEAWCRRSLAEEDVVRLILDGTVVRVRLDRKATSISLLVMLGIRRDGQKMRSPLKLYAAWGFDPAAFLCQSGDPSQTD